MIDTLGGVTAKLPSITGELLPQWRVMVSIKHIDGTIEPRVVYLEHLTRDEALLYVQGAERDPLVIKARVERDPQQ